MKNKRIIDSWNKIGPDDAAEARMLGAILARNHLGTTKEGETITMKRTIKRKWLVPIVACLTLFALTGTAFAANVFGIRDYFSEVFGHESTEMSINDLGTLENLGTADMPTATSDGAADTSQESTDAANKAAAAAPNGGADTSATVPNNTADVPAAISGGATMTPVAAVYDGSRYYLALNVTAPDGTVLDRGDAYWQFDDPDTMEYMSLTSLDGKPIPFSAATMSSDDTPGDNELTIIAQITLYDGSQFGDGQSKFLRIPGVWLQSEDKTYTKVLDGVWEFDIGKYGVAGKVPGAE
jgi:hypothetical protein